MEGISNQHDNVGAQKQLTHSGLPNIGRLPEKGTDQRAGKKKKMPNGGRTSTSTEKDCHA